MIYQDAWRYPAHWMATVYSDEFVSSFQPTGNGSLVESLVSRSEPPVSRFRDQIEGWFEHVDKKAGKVLLPGLRSVNDNEFYPSFFSLVLHRFLEQSGWTVEFTPGEISRPTFRITVPQPSAEFDLEVAAVMPAEAAHGREQTLYDLLNSINQISTVYNVAIHVRRWPPRGFDPTDVRDSLARWLDSLVDDEAYASRRAQYVDGPVDIEFAILGRNDAPQTGAVSLWLAPLGMEEHFAGLQDAIEGAVNKARAEAANVRRPFVVALCHADTWGVSENTVMTELYGKPRGIRASSGHGGGRRKVYDYSRLFRKALFNKPGNEALSAVLFLEKCWQDSEVCYDLKVFHNPWSNVPVPFEVFSILPQLVPLQGGDQGPLLSWRNHTGQIVSLDE